MITRESILVSIFSSLITKKYISFKLFVKAGFHLCISTGISVSIGDPEASENAKT